MILYKRRQPNRTTAGREAAKAAKGENDTTHCPNCGNLAELTEKYKDRATYKCIKCKAVNTFTRPPTDYERVQKNHPKQTVIVVRDKSKKEKKEEPKKEEDKETEKIPHHTIDTIRKSLQHAKMLNFNYMDRNGNKSNRNVEPYKLVRKSNGEIILYAYCVDNGGIRTFKINRIRKAIQSSFVFEPRWPLEDNLGDVK